MQKQDEKDMYVNKQDMAYLLGISVRALAEWNISPVGKSKNEVYYSIKQTIAYARQKWQQKTTNLTIQKERLLSIKAQKAEKELEEYEEQLVHTEVVKAVWSNQLSYFKSRLASIPYKLSASLVGMKTKQKIEAKLTEALNEALNELSAYDSTEYQKAKNNPLYGVLSEASEA